jgi:hypothetical protein
MPGMSNPPVPALFSVFEVGLLKVFKFVTIVVLGVVLIILPLSVLTAGSLHPIFM